MKHRKYLNMKDGQDNISVEGIFIKDKITKTEGAIAHEI